MKKDEEKRKEETVVKKRKRKVKKHKEKHNWERRTNKERAVDDKIRRWCVETPLENERKEKIYKWEERL